MPVLSVAIFHTTQRHGPSAAFAESVGGRSRRYLISGGRAACLLTCAEVQHVRGQFVY